jgi:hypothetical protein
MEVDHLPEEYKNPTKRFIISNWEGDNAVCCGAASNYAAALTSAAPRSCSGMRKRCTVSVSPPRDCALRWG